MRAAGKCGLLCAAFFFLAPLVQADQNSASGWATVKKWIALHNSLKTLSADFTQTRALQTLRSPLVSKGHFWFSAPDSFRWDLGEPAKTIVLRTEGKIEVIHPAKKKVERIAKDAEDTGMTAVGMMRFPSAKNVEDFRRQFEIQSIETRDGICRLTMLPRDARMKNALKAIRMDIDEKTDIPAAIEIVTKEGSSIRNEFHNVQINPGVNPSVFNYDLSGFSIIDAKE